MSSQIRNIIKVEGLSNLQATYQILSKFGSVKNLTKGSNCFYCSYPTEEQAQTALETLNKKGYKSCYIVVQKPNCLIFYNIIQEDINEIKTILKRNAEFSSLVQLITDKGHVPIAVAYFNSIQQKKLQQIICWILNIKRLCHTISYF